MKKHFLQAWLLPASVLVFALNSCGNDGNGTTTDSVGTDTVAAVDTSMNREFARVPSPADLFSFMKAGGATNANANSLNPTDAEKKYESKKAQSVNLGIYSADLLYCSTFGISDKVVSYFGACMRMGDKLKVATNLNDKDKERINKNAGNGDSLITISNDMYLSTFENLENTERGSDLSLMLSGGWVEGLYLMSTMVKDFDKDKSIAEHLVDQKMALSNLIDFMSEYEKDADVKGVADQLRDLKKLMDEVSSTGTNAGASMKNGKRVIGGGAKSSVTKEQFEAIRTKLTEIRTGLVNLQ